MGEAVKACNDKGGEVADEAAQAPAHGYYLYCFASADRIKALAGPSVDEEHPVFIHAHKGIVAIVSRVHLSDFTGDEAEANFQDISWLTPRIFRHERVIEQAMPYSAVFPVRFGTLFTSLHSLEMELEKRRSAIVRSLDKVAGKQEWAVTGILDREQAQETLFADILGESAQDIPALPGMRYLYEQRIHREVEQTLKAWKQQLCFKIGEELTAHADGFHQRKIVSPSESGKVMMMNWAFLVSLESVNQFHACVERISRDHGRYGLQIKCTGPLPPYSFSERSN